MFVVAYRPCISSNPCATTLINGATHHLEIKLPHMGKEGGDVAGGGGQVVRPPGVTQSKGRQNGQFE